MEPSIQICSWTACQDRVWISERRQSTCIARITLIVRRTIYQGRNTETSITAPALADPWNRARDGTRISLWPESIQLGVESNHRKSSCPFTSSTASRATGDKLASTCRSRIASLTACTFMLHRRPGRSSTSGSPPLARDEEQGRTRGREISPD